MSGGWSRLKRRLLTVAVILAVLAAVVGGAGYVVIKYSVRPLVDDAQLGDGAVTTVVAGSFGPIAIAAYVFELADGGVGLIDTGMDPTAAALRAALARRGRTLADVRAIFITHEHADHAGGVAAFPQATLYVPEVLLSRFLQRRTPEMPARRSAVEGYQDGERLDVFGTPVEVFTLPGHSPGSVAILVHGVLFLGDAAASIYDGTLRPNTFVGNDPERNVQSLRAVAERLRPRRSDVRHIAFGHQGPLDGLDPLLDWADGAGAGAPPSGLVAAPDGS